MALIGFLHKLGSFCPTAGVAIAGAAIMTIILIILVKNICLVMVCLSSDLIPLRSTNKCHGEN